MPGRINHDASKQGTVLLTGGSGVVGSALLRRLRGWDVVCLTHQTPVSATVRTVRGDLTAQLFGLPNKDYRRLAAEVDVVVHAAAVTDFTRADLISATNIGGTATVAAFTAAADAHLVHVSTAFVAAGAGRDPSDHPALRYAAAKRAAEDVVGDMVGAGGRATIVRPSIVIGDSRTGQISRYQGVYQVASAFLRGQIPVAPVDPGWFLDTVPQDVVADTLVGLLDGSRAGDAVWITAGDRALTLGRATDLLRNLAEEFGRPVHPPRFVPADTYDRLIAPVFLQALPARMRLAVGGLLQQLSAYLVVADPYPTSLASIPDPATTFETAVRRWATESGFARTVAVTGAA